MEQVSPTVLVLGATGGIGQRLVHVLAGAGYQLAVAARTQDRLNELAAEVGGIAHPLDASDFQEVTHAVDRTLDAFGTLDAVVNCVGSILLKPAHLTTREDWDSVISTNLTSAFATVRAAARPMMRQKRGSIVLISSAAGQHGLPNHEAIAAAKAGIGGLVRAAAATYGRAGVRVNAVSPGLVETPATARITGNERTLQNSQAMHALGRIGQPEDVVSAIAWLIGPSASWVTGQVIGVDGGLSTARAG
ncbi:MAG: SDR family oxidoreductase [Gemmatimonadota bacterium]|nr:SDR family oxidoreductase [Gemmatimonadota bacterium]